MSSPPGLPHAPMGGPPLPPSPARRLPWEQRSELGWVEGFVQTFRLLVASPGEGFSRLRPDGDLGSPLLFGIIVTWIGMLVSQLWNVVWSNALRGMFGSDELGQFFQAPTLFGIAGLSVVWPLIFVVITFVGSGILHLSLMLVGGTSDAGFEGTFKVYCYATVAWLGSLIPVAGGIVTGLWTLVLQVVGLAAVHRTTQGRALLAVLIPSIVCCLCGIGLAVMFGAVIVETMRQMSP